MPVLAELAGALASGTVEVIDLTAPLSSSTPTLQLPPQFGQTAAFELEEISRYDERGPAWYWNNFRTGEHTGTHFDAPKHWITGQDGEDVASAPPRRLVGLGVETVGTDAGAAVSFDPMFPCHTLMHGAGKYGLTQLQNLAELPATGAILVVSPLKIVGGSGSPARVLALVEH